MNFEQRIREKFEHFMKLDAGEPKLRSAQAGKDVGYADSPKSSGVLAPAPSPVAAQIEVLASQLTGMVCLLGELIDKVRPVLSGDPRNQLESACPDETASCEMEGELIVLSGKLSRCNDLLNTTIRHIQL